VGEVVVSKEEGAAGRKVAKKGVALFGVDR
jgi:hypothetical protein